jgi:hypothetical protein
MSGFAVSGRHVRAVAGNTQIVLSDSRFARYGLSYVDMWLGRLTHIASQNRQ